ncbi:ABC transporter substrate-binding protein [Candidatus Bipolaricaulota bacterium]
MHRKPLWCLLTVAVLVMSVAPLVVAEKVHTHAVEYRVITIDPGKAQLVENTIITANTYEGLMIWDLPAMSGTGALAESREIAADGKSCTFYLRRGVKFHDGTDFDAAAVEYSWNRMKAIGAGPAQSFTAVSGLEIIDDYTVKFTSDDTFAFWDNVFASVDGFKVCSPTAAEANKTADDPWAENYFAENVVGTGPYMMTEWVKGQYVILEKFADYWGGWNDLNYDKVVLRIMTEPAARAAAIQAGEVDSSTSVPSDMYATLDADPNLTVHVTESSSIQAIYMKSHRGVLANKYLRKAISYAVDYDSVRQCMAYSVAPCGPLASWLPGGSQDYDCIQHQDLEKAAFYLELAGYAPGDLELDFSIITPVGWHDCLGAIVQQNLADAGIKVNLFQKTWPDFSAESRDANASNVMSTQYGAAAGAEPYDVLYLNYSDDSALDPNWGWNNGYVNPLLSGWIDAMATEPDNAKREELAAKVSEVMIEDAPVVWLFTVPYIIVMRSDIDGYYGIPINRALILFYQLQEA